MEAKNNQSENQRESNDREPEMSDLVMTILYEELTQIKNLVSKNEENVLNWELLTSKQKNK